MNEYDNLKTVLDAGRALGTPITTESSKAVIVVPTDHTALAFEKVIEPYLDAPRRTKAKVALANADSFVRYVKDFQSSDTRIFAIIPPNNGAPSFVAILDYHSPEGASWCEHRATLDCSFTEEWRRWMASNTKRMSQVEFATFLEENQRLIINPPGAELLDLISTLEGHNNINVSQAIKLNNGRVKLNYEEDVVLKGGGVGIQNGAVEMPLIIKTQIQMFEGGIEYRLDNRLRYRLEPKKITFWYEVVDVHLNIKDAVKDVVTLIKEKLEIEPLFGVPQ